MSSAKQRSNKGGSPAATPPAEKGAHDDVAKKPQHQGHPKGSKGAGASSSSSSFCSFGRVLTTLLSLLFLAGASLSGFYLHHLLGEVQQVGLRQEGFARQREDLARDLQAALHKVNSLQDSFGGFEVMLKNAQQKQEITERAVRQGESEINRIGEVLQKLQNEILKDLSDGIHVVKDARERDFTSLENTVEERLTELTKSINDNIAEFTDVQKRSQDEINEVKKNLASLGEIEACKHDYQVLKGIVDEMQTSMRDKEKTIESLQSTIDLMESDVLSEVKELINLKQEHEKFKEAADTEHLSLQALEEKVLKAEDSIAHLPDEIKRLSEDLLRTKRSTTLEEDPVLTKDDLESLQESNNKFESRLGSIEESLQAVMSQSAPRMEEMERDDSKIAALEEGLSSLRQTLEDDVRFLTDTVRSLGEAKLSMYNDVGELRKSVSNLSNNADALDNIQKQVRALLDQEQSQGHLGELSSVKGSIDELRSSLGQTELDMKMLRTVVDNLVAYPVKIETIHNMVLSVKSSLDDIRNDLDRLFLKVEKIHEKI
ncbi:cytoskeleton-associated protein 4 [Anolis carolinensis]|uniref:cytoskeleton-associated protein 4 n=1 Tax=Anolis carolinensis TaxID=28377 RepID=UPI002F2B8B84